MFLTKLWEKNAGLQSLQQFWWHMMSADKGRLTHHRAWGFGTGIEAKKVTACF